MNRKRFLLSIVLSTCFAPTCVPVGYRSAISRNYTPPVACVETMSEVQQYHNRRVVVRGKYVIPQTGPWQTIILLKDGTRVGLRPTIRHMEARRFQGKQVRVAGDIYTGQTATKAGSAPLPGPLLNDTFPVFFLPGCAFSFLRTCPCRLKNYI